jgi:hypothetical protein
MHKIYKVVDAGEKFGKLVCVSCKKNLLMSFLCLLDNICAILLDTLCNATRQFIYYLFLNQTITCFVYPQVCQSVVTLN